MGDGLSVLGVGSGLSDAGVAHALESPPPAPPPRQLSIPAPPHVGTLSDAIVVVNDAIVVASVVGDIGELNRWLSMAAEADDITDRFSSDDAADN